jgi:hypothetical protein
MKYNKPQTVNLNVHMLGCYQLVEMESFKIPNMREYKFGNQMGVFACFFAKK